MDLPKDKKKINECTILISDLINKNESLEKKAHIYIEFLSTTNDKYPKEKITSLKSDLERNLGNFLLYSNKLKEIKSILTSTHNSYNFKENFNESLKEIEELFEKLKIDPLYD